MCTTYLEAGPGRKFLATKHMANFGQQKQRATPLFQRGSEEAGTNQSWKMGHVTAQGLVGSSCVVNFDHQADGAKMVLPVGSVTMAPLELHNLVGQEGILGQAGAASCN